MKLKFQLKRVDDGQACVVIDISMQDTSVFRTSDESTLTYCTTDADQ